MFQVARVMLAFGNGVRNVARYPRACTPHRGPCCLQSHFAGLPHLWKWYPVKSATDAEQADGLEGSPALVFVFIVLLSPQVSGIVG
jgi:hypothetical protein